MEDTIESHVEPESNGEAEEGQDSVKKGNDKTKNYKCEKCQTSFKDTYHLNRHMVVHDGSLKKYNCTFCGKKFATNYSLQDHKKALHFLGKKHKCDVCQKGFNRPIRLKNHIAKHHNEDVNKETVE